MTTLIAVIATIRRQLLALAGRRDHNTDRVL